MATLVGALSPFCSCGVIPIITALLLGGVPLAPVMSFWLASPSMDPEIFVLSVGSIGWELAIWRLAATFVMSLGGGLVVLWLERKGWIGRDFLRPSVAGTARADRADSGASPSLACRLLRGSPSAPVAPFRGARGHAPTAACRGCSPADAGQQLPAAAAPARQDDLSPERPTARKSSAGGHAPDHAEPLGLHG